jgi:hypothetical protein
MSKAKSKWVIDQCAGVDCMHGKGVWERVGELANGLKKSKPTAPCTLHRGWHGQSGEPEKECQDL